MLQANKKLAESIIGVLRKNRSKKVLLDAQVSYTGMDVLRTVHSARILLSKIVPPGGRVGILLPSSSNSAAAVLSLMALGYIPVMLDISCTAKRLKRVLDTSALDCLVALEKFSLPSSYTSPILRVNHMGVVRLEKGDQSKAKLTTPRKGTALVLYTSGSSGEPKGVQISADSIFYTVKHLIKTFELDEHSVSGCVLPICHTMGLNTQFFPAFFAGACCEFSPASLGLGSTYRRILKSKASFIGLISELVHFCYEEKKRKKLPPAFCVKHVQLAGGFIREEHLNMVRELFPNALIHKGYGLTEAIRVSMINSKDPKFQEDTAGYLLPGHIAELRSETGEILPAGSMGHLYVKGPNVMLGYDNIVSKSPIEQDFLNTGDMATISSDGRVLIHGRHDSIFKVKGKRVAGKDIESTVRSLTNSFLDVKCLSVACTRRGARPVLFLEINENKLIDFLAREKMDFEKKLREELEDNGQTPKDIYLVEGFPRTGNGKLMHKQLSALLQAESATSKENSKVSILGRDSLGFKFSMVSFLEKNSKLVEAALPYISKSAG